MCNFMTTPNKIIWQFATGIFNQNLRKDLTQYGNEQKRMA